LASFATKFNSSSDNKSTLLITKTAASSICFFEKITYLIRKNQDYYPEGEQVTIVNQQKQKS
jgi:hypothetical protein